MTYEKWPNLFYQTNLKKTRQIEKRKLETAFAHQKVTESEMLRYVMVVLVVTRGTLSQCERNLWVGGVRDDKWTSALTHLRQGGANDDGIWWWRLWWWLVMTKLMIMAMVMMLMMARFRVKMIFFDALPFQNVTLFLRLENCNGPKTLSSLWSSWQP